METIDIFECLHAGALCTKLKYLKLVYNNMGFEFDEPVNFRLITSDRYKKNQVLHQDDTENPLEVQEYLIKKSIFNTNKIIHDHSDLEGTVPTDFGTPVIGSNLDVHSSFVKTLIFQKFFENTTNDEQYKNIILKNKLPVIKNKICFWRFNFWDVTNNRYGRPIDKNNPTIINKKNVFSNKEWDTLLRFLKKYFYVEELYYRMPIREVYYHLSTCEFSVGTSGMYHSLSTGLGKPHISFVLTKNSNEKFTHQNELMVLRPELQKITDIDFFKSLVKRAEKRQL